MEKFETYGFPKCFLFNKPCSFALFKVLLSKFGKVLIDGCSDICYNKKLIETFRQIGHKKSKASENTSDHFIVSNEILKTVCLFSVPSLFQFIGVTDREFYYQQGL